MSTRVVILCDGLGDTCEEDAANPSWPNVKAARADLATQGWTSQRGDDYCPGCSAERGKAAAR